MSGGIFNRGGHALKISDALAHEYPLLTEAQIEWQVIAMATGETFKCRVETEERVVFKKVTRMGVDQFDVQIVHEVQR